jgi:hypothetical protein
MKWFVAGLILIPATSSALPNMIRLGYPNCVSCHVAPQGGGILNLYGRGVDEAQSHSAGEYEPGTNRIVSRLSLNGRIDQDVRAVPSMQLSHTPGGPYATIDRARIFYRNVTTLGSGFRLSTLVNAEDEPATRKARAYDPIAPPGHVLIASALVQYRPKDGVEFAVGRDSLPTGLNIPDQTTFIKARNRLGYYDTPTQAKAFLWTKRWLISSFVFGPGGHEPIQAREKGEGFLAEYDLLGRGTTVVGVNTLRGTDHSGKRLISGIYTRLGFGKWGILAEYDLTARHMKAMSGDVSFEQHAGYAQVFFYPREWIALSAITERLTVQRLYVESLWAYKGELSMRLTSNWSFGVRSGAQRDALTGVVTPVASVQLAAKTVH